jgi:multiple sugar transport system substrate-binding protein
MSFFIDRIIPNLAYEIKSNMSIIVHMEPVELSIIEGNNYEAEVLKRLGVEARIVSSPWNTYWSDILNVAFHRYGPDVSQVGAPSTGGVISMNVLRPFSRQEIGKMGGEEVFVPECWRTTRTKTDPIVWAIPFEADVRVMYYWEDLLEKAKVQPETAFQSPGQFEETLVRLQASGVQTPWAFFAAFPYATLHVASMWVWQPGGEILEGSHFALTEPPAMDSLKALFRLKKYMPRHAYQAGSTVNLADTFARRDIAVICAGPNMIRTLREEFKTKPALLKQLGVALPPGPAYIGGSNLMVWRHTRQEARAVALVQKLASKEVQMAFSQQTGYLPTRLDALGEAPYSTDPDFQVMVQALMTGRAFPNLPRWGLVEDRLSTAFLQIWGQLYQNPEAESDTVLERVLEPLGNRLNLTLAEFG